jgi:hypothetical protein
MAEASKIRQDLMTEELGGSKKFSSLTGQVMLEGRASRGESGTPLQRLRSRAEIEDLVRAQLAHLADLTGSRIRARGPKLRLKAGFRASHRAGAPMSHYQRREIRGTLNGYRSCRCLLWD